MTANKSSIYHIALLRHGESTGNANGFFQGQHDYPLTARGEDQAHALANYWLSKGVAFDLIVSSPLARARTTAEIISSALVVPLELDPLWMERNAGYLSGLNREEAEDRYPRPAFIHPYMAIGETGESQWQLFLRAGKAVQSFIVREPGRFLVVSHGGILNMVLYAILGIAPQANFQGARFRFSNTAYATLEYNPDEHDWVVLGLNQRPHWDER